KKSPEEITSFLLKYGIKIVGLKMGKKGCFLCKQGEKGTYIPAFPVKAVDTTGAGDAWVAGFLTGFIKGWPLEKIGSFANGVGALSTLSFGAVGGVKSIEETLKFMCHCEER
ncbi:MAG: carbohydrate kinase family protein, partial [Acidobacteriota bacterium]|nr:carbohydrate kinase family protein [Acidobacteriota bacterium]